MDLTKVKTFFKSINIFNPLYWKEIDREDIENRKLITKKYCKAEVGIGKIQTVRWTTLIFKKIKYDVFIKHPYWIALSVFLNIGYKKDYEEGQKVDDIWQDPVVTLKKGTGDCEDQAILLCSILRKYEFEARVVLADKHAWVMIYVDDKIRYLDTTKCLLYHLGSFIIPRFVLNPNRFDYEIKYSFNEENVYTHRLRK